jgi:DNA-binding NtrC family response regulator
LILDRAQRASYLIPLEAPRPGSLDCRLTLPLHPGTTTGAEVPDLTLMEAMERNAILQMLKDTGGNKLETAKRLGIGRQTLYNKIKMYGIEA